MQKLAKENDTTMYVVLLSAFQLLLYRYTNQSIILVGSPFINRDKVALEKLIGFFNETLVLRTQLSDELSFKQLIAQVKETTMQAFEHRDMPFDELVQNLKIKRQGNRNPLFQTMFVYNNSNTSTAIELDLKIEEETIELGVSKFDLTFFATDHQDYLEIALECSLELFEEDTILRMQNHLELILNAIATNPRQVISKIPLLTQSEQKQILIDWNDTKIPIPKYQGIHHLIEKMALKFPDKIAVVFEDKKMTYAQLEQKANHVSALLSKTNKVQNTIVGLFVERSIEMIVGILGILKAAAAYLPLDAEYPKERIEFMLADAEVNVVLCQSKLIEQAKFSDVKILELNISKESSFSNLSKPKEFSKDSLAYLIYTSGSTGQPKGVPISHQNLIHSTTARFHFFEKQPDAFLLLSSFSFDSSVAGIFWTLCSGGTLVVSKKRIEQDINALSNTINNNNITHTLLLPSLYHLLLQHASAKKLDSLNTVMVAGEACSSNLVSLHFKQLAKVALVNEYGPTEGTVWCTAHRLSPKDAFGLVPIGRPIPNVQNYILDKNLQAVPVGVIGELYIGGAGLANAYWKRRELSKTKFLLNPFSKNEKTLLYKTGDLARFRKNGLIDFLGRADQQVKIRGHRIELDEIKTRLLQIDSIQDAIVLIQNPKRNPQIIAYLIAKENKDINYKNSLKEKLPDYMIPSAFILLEKFPKLPNGKVDLTKLPKPKELILDKTADFLAPKTAIEKQLVSIWEDVLKIKPISIHSNFFDLGGDSIRSIQVISKAYKQGIEIAPQAFFEYQNIEALAHFLEKNNNSSTNQVEDTISASLVPLNKRGTKSPLFCIHSGGGHVFFYQALSNHLGANQTMYALQPLGLDGKEKVHSSIEEMASFYIQEMQKVQATGPYHLLGTCFSNAVGLEMANQLKAKGEEIATLIFVDSGPQYLLGAKLRGERKTARRFAQMIKEKNWKGIQRKFRNRWIRSKQKLLAPLENKQEKNLRLTINSLNQL
ncbi:MAG TPA: amino acid adenylation domain-containing protein, partial [Saprospiraceae bacterium]|nr:amino acid adenylation domain-containing protein [Saprospiraceae bacterium]